MNKRLLLALPALILAGSAFTSTIAVAHAEAEEPETAVETPVDEPVEETPAEAVEEPEAEVFECTVSDTVYRVSDDGTKTEDADRKYGDVYITELEGHVNDVVTIIVASNFYFNYASNTLTTYRYTLKSVEVNGAEIKAVEGNKYEFSLVEGLNKVDVTFKGMTPISVTDLSKMNRKSLLTADNLVKLFFAAVAALASSGYIITAIKKMRADKKNQEAQEKSDEKVAAKIDSALDEKIPEAFQKRVVPQIMSMADKEDSNSQISQSILKCFVAFMSGDKKTNLIVADELMKINVADKDQVQKTKELIEQCIAESDAKKEAQAKALKEAEEANERLTPTSSEKPAEKAEEDEYGQL